jgi:uncharacterized protein YodC (DUF2158 family)
MSDKPYKQNQEQEQEQGQEQEQEQGQAELEIGDVVKLRSGGHIMTLTKILYECSWITQGEYHSKLFFKDQLKRA